MCAGRSPAVKRPRLDDAAGAGPSPSTSSANNDFADIPGTESLTYFEKRILSLAKQFPKGIPNKIIQNDSPTITSDERAAAINNLLGRGLLDLYKQGNELLYKVKTPKAEPTQMRGADEEEKVVYDIIATAENKGIWIRDIRFKSNLTMPQLNKVLKSLEVKRLIKTVKSVAASKKKVYMLYDLEPDRSLTGGAFYSDQDFEQEFVSILNQQCYRFLESKREMARLKQNQIGLLAARRLATATQKEIWEYIKNLGISKVELSMEDIESILDTLIYDDKIEMVPEGSVKTYYSRGSFGVEAVLDSFPCGVCPVFKECRPDGPINPSSCLYMTNWLALETAD